MSEAAYTAALKEIRDRKDATVEAMINGSTVNLQDWSPEKIGVEFVRLFSRLRALDEADKILVAEWRKAYATPEDEKDNGEDKPEIY